MGLTLYNSLGRQKVSFEPLDQSHVRVYACGPTVYSFAHIGNARMSVVFDILVRLLRKLYPQVTYVSNITDIDDKIMVAAEKENQPISAITNKYADIYNADMAALGVLAPDIQPRATDHVPQMIAMIEKLIANGHAYEAEGHVLFSVPSMQTYGRLSGRNRDEQIAGARVDVAPYKKDPADFVLWKPSTDNQPGWESPWGYGRPGWHIECSAMSAEYLGELFDIHGGGVDLTFPHHENERAQSTCAHGCDEQARYWVHNGFVMVEGEKMSKSLGNVTLVHDLIETAPGEAIRLALLTSHYRQPLDWTATGLEQAKATLDKFYKVIADNPSPAGDVPEEVMTALQDDLNVPRVLAAMHVMAGDKDVAGLKATGELLGLLQQDPVEWFETTKKQVDLTDAEIDALVTARNQARADKDFAKADAIRDDLLAKGIVIKDSADGTTWSVG